MNMNNNLFHYATSELSQDAFLCWLFSFALKDADDEPALKSCAVDFLRQFIPELNGQPEVWLSRPAERQYKSIDILLTVNDTYKIIIEDKTYTREHDNQLQRYYDTVTADFPGYIVKGVYFKTGFQSNRSEIDQCGYAYFGLDRILHTIEKYALHTSNLIFLSYYHYLNEFSSQIKAYLTLPIWKWGWAQINGFYDSLKNDTAFLQGMNCDYRYVANPSGGFYGMWLYNDNYHEYQGHSYELYLQCEFSNGSLRICYKASAQSGEKIDKSAREYFIWKEEDLWVNIAEKNGFKKPSRYGCGKTVTLGSYSPADEADIHDLYYQDVKNLLSNAICAFKQTVKELMSPSDHQRKHRNIPS